MNHPTLATVESLDKSGCGVRVDFLQDNDRFSHVIQKVSRGTTKLLLASWEGGNDDVEPPSPPFSEWHQQENTVFLTGSTTSGHWSMSVEAVENGLLFDVACRVTCNTSHLGSEYHIDDLDVRELFGVNLEQALIDETIRKQVRIVPAMPMPHCFPATIQWRYTIECL